MPRGKKQPVEVAPSSQYGQGVALQAAQQAIPLPDNQAPVAATQPQQPVPLPALTPLNALTTRPLEPVTHGLPSGPGGGPEVLGMPTSSIADMLTQAAQASGSQSLAVLAQRAQQMGQ